MPPDPSQADPMATGGLGAILGVALVTAVNGLVKALGLARDKVPPDVAEIRTNALAALVAEVRQAVDLLKEIRATDAAHREVLKEGLARQESAFRDQWTTIGTQNTNLVHALNALTEELRRMKK